MLFNSLEFLFFLPVVFVLYWFVFRERRWQNLLVVCASYVFYGWWDWRFLLLIAFTSLCSFISGRLIEHWAENRRRARTVSAANIVLNLGILGVFKYYNFFAENFSALLSAFGWQLDWVVLDVLLPVGISFYTFQALSYSIDVYRGNIRATHDWVEFFAYISFFPQLVAGPIERATNLLPQFQAPRTFQYDKAVDGLRQMLWGFFKKMVIADNCASAVNLIWADYGSYHSLTLLFGAVLFAFQIYCDFSGYSDIAIGCARLFGIDLKQNFRFPYFSRNVADFWRRWHISLMKWFTDYIYIPLGGSRCGRWKTSRNTFVVFLVSGLWHGADWTFVAWGGYHAMLVVLLLLLVGKPKRGEADDDYHLLPSAKEAFQMLITFCLVVVGWVLFRAPTLGDAAEYTARLFDVSQFGLTESLAEIQRVSRRSVLVTLSIAFLLLAEWLGRSHQHALEMHSGSLLGRSKVLRYAFYLFLALLIGWFSGSQSQFIYFQF